MPRWLWPETCRAHSIQGLQGCSAGFRELHRTLDADVAAARNMEVAVRVRDEPPLGLPGGLQQVNVNSVSPACSDAS